jgi:nucleoside-diphosphate-sugar epimerase
MKILITGSTGFVGQNLRTYLVGNSLVDVEDLNFRNELPSPLPYADVLIHMAGKAHDLRKSTDDAEYFYVNTTRTQALFDLFLNSEIKDFIYFSSVKAVCDVVPDILTEDVLPTPLTPYGKSKLAAERYILEKKLPEGKRVFILRPCMIHGPGNKGNLNLLYKVVKKRIPYPLGAFDNRRSFLSIDNLIHIIERIIMDRTISGGIYNLADDDPLSTNQLIEIMNRALGKRPLLWKIDKSFILFLANIGDKLDLPLNSERLTKLTESYVVSNTKIKEALMIKNLPTTSVDGIMRTIKTFHSLR